MRDDASYFYDRAEVELELAQRATHPMAVRAHYIIANHYLDRCYGSEAEPGEVTAADGIAVSSGAVSSGPVSSGAVSSGAAPFRDAASRERGEIAPD